jgi:Na+/H+ antiporter NhaD/arsenite permease-like protein
MLWIGGQVTALNIIKDVFLPSLVSIAVPLIILSFRVKGNVIRPSEKKGKTNITTTAFQKKLILIIGVGALLFVPIIKSTTDLPPFMGMLFGLSVLWIVTEIMHRNATIEERKKLTVLGALKQVDMGTIFFFMGILMAVGLLESAGHLEIMSEYLSDNFDSIYSINLIIGVFSSIIDNVPLVAGTMGMYPIADPATATGFMENFVTDGGFWELLAYCAGTGGSILIIGSAAGVAAMSLQKIDFIWYLKNITLLALVGYLAGTGVYYLQSVVFGF